jgi:hypothetical protein
MCLPPETLDDLDHIFTAVAAGTRELEQVADLPDDLAALGPAGDTHAAAACEVDGSLLAQQVQRSEHGVLVDAEYGGEVDRWRESLAGTDLTFGDRTADLSCDLIVKSHRVVAIHDERDTRG